MIALMRVAVLADIHGNLPALQAVLDEVERESVDSPPVDRIVLLGDIAAGPMPAETLDVLAGLGDRAAWVRGNADRELVAAFDQAAPAGAEDSRSSDDAATTTARACARLINHDHRDLLDALPLSVSLKIEGLGSVLFCHATPRRDDEMVLVDSPLQRWNAVLAGVPEQVVVCGHTHMPFDRLANGIRVVNPGSVGMSYAGTGARWAILGPRVDLRRTEYCLESATELIATSGYARAAEWAQEYVVSPHGDAEALAAFTTVAAQQSRDSLNRS